MELYINPAIHGPGLPGYSSSPGYHHLTFKQISQVGYRTIGSLVT